MNSVKTLPSVKKLVQVLVFATTMAVSAQSIAGFGIGDGFQVEPSIWDNVQVPAPSCIGHEGIRHTVDEAVINTLRNANIPGLTVAITQNGRLVYNCGFGFSNWNTQERMHAQHSAPVGSSSKVPAALAMMHLIDNDSTISLDSKVYGSNGILNDSSYSDAITQGLRRHYPIVGVSIGRNNRTTAWFSDGKYTVGNSTDLDAHSGPQDFFLPHGKKMSDLLGIARGGTDNRVYSWYRDGTYSVGIKSDLGTFGGGNFESRRKDLIVGIAADTRSNTFYAYYHDGVVTSGDSPADLMNRWEEDDYDKDYVTSGDQQRRYDIVGVARSDNDVTVTWYSDGKVSKGVSTNLVSTWAPRNYSRRGVPNSISQWQTAYRNIEIQHLLSHTSGLTHSGQYDQARIKYALPEDETSYQYSNLYVLSTRPLLFKPGQDNEYSNHGMGLIGHLISELSGVDWYTYLFLNILNPAHATNIAPVGMFNDPDFDSRSHSVNGTTVTVLPVDVNSTPGSAAGSLKASAGDLLKVLVATDQLNNHPDVLSSWALNAMESRPFPSTASGRALGWQVSCQGSNCNGKRLWHNGQRGDGTSFMAKYLGYEVNGINVDGINVAVVSNRGGNITGELGKLANKIAREVAIIGTPENFDLFNPVVF